MNRRITAFIVVPILMALTGFAVHWVGRPPSAKVRAETINPSVTFGYKRVRASESEVLRTASDAAKLREMPPTERSLITGAGALDSASYFDCWVTNRSTWSVSELQFRIAAGQTAGSTRWERNYREYVQLPPGQACHINFKVADGKDAETLWEIIGARGVPSR